MRIGETVNKVVGKAGLEIRRRRTARPGSMAEVVTHIAGLGWRPATVIDVGVADGTPGLYDSFPEAALLLVEPLAEFEPLLARLCQEHRGQYVLAAAGDQEGEVTLNVHTVLSGSSLLHEVEGSQVDGTPRTVPTVKLDAVCAERDLVGPYLLKVDVQGAELLVLSGAESVLEDTGVALLEVSLFPFFDGGAQLHDVVVFMKDHGFVAYDIFGGHRRHYDGALAQVDMAFVKEDGPFRAFHGYANPEQRAKIH